MTMSRLIAVVEELSGIFWYYFNALVYYCVKINEKLPCRIAKMLHNTRRERDVSMNIIRAQRIVDAITITKMNAQNEQMKVINSGDE